MNHYYPLLITYLSVLFELAASVAAPETLRPWMPVALKTVFTRQLLMFFLQNWSSLMSLDEIIISLMVSTCSTFLHIGCQPMFGSTFAMSPLTGCTLSWLIEKKQIHCWLHHPFCCLIWLLKSHVLFIPIHRWWNPVHWSFNSGFCWLKYVHAPFSWMKSTMALLVKSSVFGWHHNFCSLNPCFYW